MLLQQSTVHNRNTLNFTTIAVKIDVNKRVEEGEHQEFIWTCRNAKLF